jgi:MFS family permease
MIVKNKKIFLFYLFAILTYSSQGITDLFSQLQYYFFREVSGLSMTKIGLLGFIIGLPWFGKIFLAFLLDYCPIKGYRTKYYLWFDTIGLIVSYLGMIFFGLHIWTFVLFGFLINLFTSITDIANDSTLCVYEREFDLNGRGVCVQWISLAVVGLFTSLCGAKLAETMNYKLAYGICLIFPLLYIGYLKFLHYEPKYAKKPFSWGDIGKHFNNHSFVWGLVFIACLQLTPSFGLGLMAEMREHMGVSKMFVGLLGASGTVVGLIGYILYFKFGSKFDLKSILFYSIIFSAITNMFYLYIPNQLYILAYGIIFGAFSGVSFMAILTLMTNIIPKGNEGVMYAFVAGLSNLCAKGSGILSGIIYDNYGYKTTVWISSLLTLFCLVIIPKLQIKK